MDHQVVGENQKQRYSSISSVPASSNAWPNDKLVAPSNSRPIKKLREPSASRSNSKIPSGTGLRGILKTPTPSFDTIIPGMSRKRKLTVSAAGEGEHTSFDIENEERSPKRHKFSNGTIGEGPSAKGPRGRLKENWDPEILQEIDEYVEGWIRRRATARSGQPVPITKGEKRTMMGRILHAQREGRMYLKERKEIMSQPHLARQVKRENKKRRQMERHRNCLRSSAVYESAEKYRTEVPGLLAEGGQWAILLKKRNPPVDDGVMQRLGLDAVDTDEWEVLYDERF